MSDSELMKQQHAREFSDRLTPAMEAAVEELNFDERAKAALEGLVGQIAELYPYGMRVQGEGLNQCLIREIRTQSGLAVWLRLGDTGAPVVLLKASSGNEYTRFISIDVLDDPDQFRDEANQLLTEARAGAEAKENALRVRGPLHPADILLRRY